MDNIQAMEAELLAESMLEIGPINDVLEIDAESRTINVPANELIFGVVTDQDVERKYFRCPKIVGDNIDLSSLSLRVHFENAAGNKDKYVVEDLKVDGNYVTFSWRLSKKVLMYNGTVNFAICAVYTKDDGTLVNKWNTTLATGNVLNGLEVDDLAEEEETEARDVLQQLLNLLNIQTEETIQSVKDEGESQIAKVKSEGAVQIENVSNEGLRVLNTIPEDYTSMSEQVGMLSRLTGPVIRQEVEGESIVVKDSAKMPLLGLQAFGKSSQKTTMGVQVIPYPFFNGDKDQNGISWTHQNRNDGSINVKGTATAKSVLYFTNSLYHMEAGTYTISGSTNDVVVRIDSAEADAGVWKAGIAISQGGVPVTFTLSEEDVTKYTYTLYASVESGLTVDAVVYPMINKGDIALPWEPYTGGQASPNPEYPQEITSVDNPITYINGKNLVNLDEGLNTEFVKNTDGSYTIMRNDNYRFSEFISVYVPANTPITGKVHGVSNGGYSFFYVQFMSDDSKLSKAMSISSGTDTRTMTCDYDVTKMRIYMPPAAVDGDYVTFSGFQVEIGEFATEFESYIERQNLQSIIELPGIPVSSGGNYIDENGQSWISDEVDFERGIYRSYILDIILDGSADESWINGSTGDGINNRFQRMIRVDDLVSELFRDEAYVSINAFCNSFRYEQTNRIPSVNSFRISHSKESNDYRYWYAVFNPSTDLIPLEDVDAWVNYLSEHPITIKLPLTTPIETPIPEEELQVYRELHTNYPNTTIVNDSGAHMKLTYATDTKTYIDNKFAELLNS